MIDVENFCWECYSLKYEEGEHGLYNEFEKDSMGSFVALC